jgi:hypothetical protein
MGHILCVCLVGLGVAWVVLWYCFGLVCVCVCEEESLGENPQKGTGAIYLCLWVRKRSSVFFFSIAELTLPASFAFMVMYICVVPEWVVRAYIGSIAEVKSQFDRTSYHAVMRGSHVEVHSYIVKSEICFGSEIIQPMSWMKITLAVESWKSAVDISVAQTLSRKEVTSKQSPRTMRRHLRPSNPRPPV